MFYRIIFIRIVEFFELLLDHLILSVIVVEKFKSLFIMF